MDLVSKSIIKGYYWENRGVIFGRGRKTGWSTQTFSDWNYLNGSRVRIWHDKRTHDQRKKRNQNHKMGKTIRIRRIHQEKGGD